MTLTGSPHPGPVDRSPAHPVPAHPVPAPISSLFAAPIPAPVGPAHSGRAALAAALRAASYEVLPLRGTEENVLAHVPTDVALSVTTTEAKGPEPTLDLAIRLVRHGYRAAPHLAARLVRDGAHLADIGARLREAGVTGVVVIGGDAADPLGPYPDASSLLDGLAELGHTFSSVGVGGYPEGHPKISDAALDRALRAKARHATQVVTQICFDAATTAGWARAVQARGVAVPIRVGIPGAVGRQKLVRVSAGLGLGQSARLLRKQQSMVWRFLLPGGYRPDRLVRRLMPAFGAPDNGLAGFHVFTFNDLAGTEAWRRRWLARLP